jgi:hypothetical protein
MSHFQRSGDTVELQEQTGHSDEPQEETRTAGSRLADFGDRIARAFAVHDRGRVDQFASEPGAEPDYGVLGEELDDGIPARFPVGPFGYNRAAVDRYLIEVERELAELRNQRPEGMSINEEIERLGEQTASILVVAHDQAHETRRLAQEQADRCIADAAANAVALTERAKRQLGELDNETDAVWRERRRLIEDVRITATALVTLAEDAIERFPEDAVERFPEDGKPSFEAPQQPTE